MEIKSTTTKTIVLNTSKEINTFNSIIEKVVKLSKQIGYKKELLLDSEEIKLLAELKK